MSKNVNNDEIPPRSQGPLSSLNSYIALVRDDIRPAQITTSLVLRMQILNLMMN